MRRWKGPGECGCDSNVEDAGELFAVGGGATGDKVAGVEAEDGGADDVFDEDVNAGIDEAADEGGR